jgi:hypothetical protein
LSWSREYVSGVLSEALSAGAATAAGAPVSANRISVVDSNVDIFGIRMPAG